MKLNTASTVLAAAAIIGGTALSATAFAGTQSTVPTQAAALAAGAEPITITVRSRVGEAGVYRTLDDGHEIRTWNYNDGQFWIYAPWVDNRRCTVEPAVGNKPIVVAHQDVDYKDWTLVYIYTANGASRVGATLDLTMTCPTSALVAVPESSGGRVSPPRR